MRFLPTNIHGIVDYVVAVLLLLAPSLLGFADGTAAQWVPMVLGAATIVYSLFTRYEWAVARLIPMPGHLALDALNGIILASSPWVFGFHDRVYLPHLVVGLFEIVASLITRTRSPLERAAGPGIVARG